MATKTRTPAPSPKTRELCSIAVEPPREFTPDVGPARTEAILVSDEKWVNGTVLRYHFLISPANVVGREAQRQVVRRAFEVWANVGIGIKFQEVSSPNDAEIRIGFLNGDGSWSGVGRGILSHFPAGQRTMNFGWDLTRSPRELDTAVHEIGHSLGLPHEHQNPNSGIVWNEPAVFENLAGSPNRWNHDKTFFNIIRKITPDTVQGSDWDPDSVMHYPFGPGLIKEPVKFRTGLTPAGGLSERDLKWIRTFYPPLTEADHSELQVLESRRLRVSAGGQANFAFSPAVSRDYTIATHGESDTVMVLFEQPPTGDPIFLDGNDDSGLDINAKIVARLITGRKYIVRVRLFFEEREGESAIMIS